MHCIMYEVVGFPDSTTVPKDNKDKAWITKRHNSQDADFQPHPRCSESRNCTISEEKYWRFFPKQQRRRLQGNAT